MKNNTKKIIILVIGLLLFSAILSSLCGIGSLGIRLFHHGTSGTAKTWTLKENFSNIQIKSKTGSVRFYVSSDRSAKVVWSGSKNTKLTVETNWGTLSVVEKYKLPWFLRPTALFDSSEIQVWLPKESYKELYARSDTGSIMIPSGFSFDKADINTDTGSIDFRSGVRDDLKINSDTGRITVSGIKPGNMRLNSDTGEISATNVKASKDIRLETDTGRITVIDLSCQKLDVKSDTGSLSLTNAIAADKMDLESDTGSIRLDRCDGGSIEIETDTGAIQGTLLSEKIFTAKSGTGKVNVPESTYGGPCSIKSDTGSITIEIVR